LRAGKAFAFVGMEASEANFEGGIHAFVDNGVNCQSIN
jgi:hypothetical protein